ncbi:hypothetical protein AVEN_181480-2 [Araneus ventricosus]|uniref:BED-type domain-containing protein n=1 Tax=Araneus ventricosus TaxID=182803 RepID=A0A4Y2F492_ARAVE|nr:hypothetical protein AVEN_181480-2 [Araneus ventricosus]
MRKDSQTSTCWNFFEKVEGGAKCTECKKVIACFGNTSNLMKHLRRVHKNVLNSAVVQRKRKRKDSADYEETEGEGIAPSEEEPSEAVTETSSAVHTIQAYRDVNGTTFLYLHPAPEGETGVQVQNAQFQPVVASSESITANGEIVSVAVQKDSSALEVQAVDVDAKTQEEATPRRLIHAPVKNYQGSSVATRAVVRQMTRPSPIKTAPPANSNNNNNNNSNKEDSYDAFGKYIASMLRNLPSKTACKLQGEIVNWILKEQIKNNNS